MIKKEFKIVFIVLLFTMITIIFIKLDNCKNKINELERKVNGTYVEESNNNSIKVYEYYPRNCPFCGSEAKLLFDENIDCISGEIRCENKKCEVHMRISYYEGSREELAELLLNKWNNRVE